ncbi:MAG TPA: CDP-alcohol phosphatidyltransferase family protein [Bryobacteraceae bacterium]|nr:CDP-alcohol phosphatidyltransferase family protein [Bryobacteraceae bacterium]
MAVLATETSAFKSAERAHTSFLAAAERRVLLWIATRLPAWVNSDHLTALGFTALVAAGACYAAARFTPYALLAVIPCLALNWFGDSLDGTLARVRNRQRPRYGFYIDHILDAVGSFFLMSGLALSGYMTPAVAYAFLIAYLLLSIEIYLATYSVGTFHLSYWRFGPTELRILLVIGNLFALWQPYALIAGRSLLLFDVGFAIGAAALAAILVQATVAHTRRLYKEEAGL